VKRATHPDEVRALCYFRNLVCRVYREVRHLSYEGYHPSYVVQAQRIAERTERRIEPFNDRYDQVAQEVNLSRILEPFVGLTELTLEDLHKIFAEGDWSRAYGGRAWVPIVGATIDLREAIQAGDLTKANEIADAVSKMRHNRRPVIEDFRDNCDKV
jgi:hypothetical protein